MRSFNSQFAHPQGIPGRLAGAIMALENRGRNRWAISLLELKPTDRVLEIGFGPGWAIAEMHKMVTKGRVAGVDASETMVRQAARRNALAIRTGRVELQHAPATELPFPPNSFDKVLAVNSLPFWAAPAQGLDEIRRVLKDNGRLGVTVQPVWAKTLDDIQRVAEELNTQLIHANFKNVQQLTLPAKPIILSSIGEK